MGEEPSKLKLCALNADGELIEIPSEIPTISIAATGFDELREGFAKAARSVRDFAFECKIVLKKRRIRRKQLAKAEKMYCQSFYSGRLSCEQYCNLVFNITIREMFYK